MSDLTPNSDPIPVVKTVPDGKHSLSLVWIIPIVAALIGGWLVVKTILEQGPTITIQFDSAYGLEAGKTHIKYKDFDVGLVNDIKLSEDREHFIVRAQLVKESKAFLVEDTEFWVVRPRFSGGQISGIGTLLSGSYIGIDPGQSKKEKLNYIGLEIPPAITSDRKGKEFVLHADTLGSLEVSSPINYRGFTVGDVVSYQLDQGGKGVKVRIFVNEPYDQLVNENTRFWNASGINLTLGANGVQINTDSLASILIGGLSFDTPANSIDTKLSPPNSVFKLFPDREQAMAARDNLTRELVLYFKESLRGLVPGAPMDFRGIAIGKVREINVEFDQKMGSFRFPVTVELDASQLRAKQRKGMVVPKLSEEGYRTVMETLVKNGLRAQLRSGNLLTGQLYIELDFFPDAPAAKMAWSEEGGELPTVSSDLAMIGDRVNAALSKIEKMPIEEMIMDARKTLATLDDTLQKFGKLAQHVDSELTPEAVAALASAKRASDNMEKLLATDAPVQQDAREALQELTRAAESMRVLTDYLETHPEALIRGKKKEE
jgi:paraquat-inducible protein B